MDKIEAQIDKIINLIDEDVDVYLLKNFEKQIDNEAKELLDKYNKLKEVYYETKIITDEFVQIKKELYSNPIVKEYLDNYARINGYTSYFNNKINSLINNKVCAK